MDLGYTRKKYEKAFIEDPKILDETQKIAEKESLEHLNSSLKTMKVKNPGEDKIESNPMMIKWQLPKNITLIYLSCRDRLKIWIKLNPTRI